MASASPAQIQKRHHPGDPSDRVTPRPHCVTDTGDVSRSARPRCIIPNQLPWKWPVKPSHGEPAPPSQRTFCTALQTEAAGALRWV